MFSSLFRQKYFKRKTQLIQLKSLSEFYSCLQNYKKANFEEAQYILFSRVYLLLPSETETDEPQCNRNNPLLATEFLSVYLDA